MLTIDAAGNDPTPDENNGDGSRIFNIDNGDSALFINVTIRGLTLTGGDVLASGGAILSREHFTLRDCVVSGSAAVSADPLILSYGGGIAHSDGLLAVTGSIITHNVGDFGGGIHLDGGQAFVASTIITANVGQSGAGIYNHGGVAFISRSSIRDNSAGAFSLGGGIYSSGNLSVFDTTISGNSADYGGGIFSRTETVGRQRNAHRQLDHLRQHSFLARRRRAQRLRPDHDPIQHDHRQHRAARAGQRRRLARIHQRHDAHFAHHHRRQHE